MSHRDVYESPLSARYAGREMKYLFSPDMKFRTWRRLWIALSEAEHELGLPVTAEQVEELKLKAGIGPEAGQNAGESPDGGQGQNADHGQETENGTMENVPEENHENSNGPESE